VDTLGPVAPLPSSPLVDSALETARRAHAGQTRSGSGGMDYIAHPRQVAELLADHGYAETVLAAALLHDVVENSETEVEDLRARFGDPVAGLVATLSDDESIPGWDRRKLEHRERVAAAGPEARAIYGADKLVNIATLRRAYAEQGEPVGEEFDPSLDQKVAVWETDLEMLARLEPELPFLDELAAELTLFRADRAAADPRRGT
jgi:(p)ppGpp synthase/HD superfamily hydrolase